MRFRALKDFYSPELKSQYCSGLSYTVRSQDSLLASLVPAWLDAGQIEEMVPSRLTAQVAEMTGTATVN